ncbi:DUF6642 family protein [Pedococcus soli]
MTANGVFCLEGEWNADLRKRATVLPVLELLERLGEIKAIHRDVATLPELEHYLKAWGQPRYRDFYVLYLSTHGDKGLLQWSRGNQTSLEELAALLGDSAKGCYVYLGSCLTLFNEREARAFVETTGVEALVGYRKEVDWLEGAALEVILVAWLANHYGRPSTLFKQLMKRHGQLAKLYKLVMVTKSETLRSQSFAS